MQKEYCLQKFESGMHYIKLDPKTVTSLTMNENKRVICRINDKEEYMQRLCPKKKEGMLST